MIEKAKISVFYINDTDTFSANPTDLILSQCVVGVNVSSF